MAIVGLVVLVHLAGVGMGIFTAVDASRYPEWAFQQVRSSRALWIALPIVFVVFCGLGAIVMGSVWFGSKRAEVERAMVAAGWPTPRNVPPPPPPPPPPAPSPWSPPPTQPPAPPPPAPQ